jgi:quercetin dioxygenase-like cupin family protein
LTLALFISGCGQSQVGNFDFPEGQLQHVVRYDEIDWQHCPPSLPPGCESVVLEGDPQAPGFFSVRFRVTGDFFIPPHTHPKDERVAVISGRVSVAFGANGSRADAKHFGPGDYYINARDAVHSVWADESTELQITGIGPWAVHFVE